MLVCGRCGRRGCHVEQRVVVRVVGNRGFRGMVVLVVGFLNSVVDGHRPAGTIAVLTAAPIGDVLVIITAHLVVSITVKDERCAAALGWHK